MAPPSDDDQTSLRALGLRTAPMAPVTSYRDGFGNRVDLFNVTTPYWELVVHTTCYVRAHPTPRGPGWRRASPPGEDAPMAIASRRLPWRPWNTSCQAP